MATGKELEEVFRIIAECNPDAMIIYDGERVIYANSKAAEFLGKDFKREIRELMRPDYREALMERIKRALKGDETEPFEGLVLLPNGVEKWIEVTLKKRNNQR
jgi:PAS domain S-box-containing protein